MEIANRNGAFLPDDDEYRTPFERPDALAVLTWMVRYIETHEHVTVSSLAAAAHAAYEVAERDTPIEAALHLIVSTLDQRMVLADEGDIPF